MGKRLLRMPILSRLIKNKIRELATEFFNEARSWGKARWREYIEKQFERSKTKWTLKIFPWLKEASIDDLLGVGENDWVPPPKGYPKILEIASTGSIRRKIVPITKTDVIESAKWLGYLILKAHTLGEGFVRNFLGIFAERQFTEIACRLIKTFFSQGSVLIKAREFHKKIDVIHKKIPFDVMFVVTPFLKIFFSSIEKNPFVDGATISVGGTVATPDLRRGVREFAEKHNINLYFMDIYGATEVGLMGAEGSKIGLSNAMAYLPTHVGIIRTEDGKAVNILDAPRGTRGEYLVSKFGDYMIPNYKIGDIIEVVETDTAFGTPAIRVLGRAPVIPIEMRLSKIGEIKANGMWFLRLPTCCLSGLIYMGLLEEGINSLFVVEDRKTKSVCRIYVTKPLSVDKFKEAVLKYDPDFSATYLIRLIDEGITEIDIVYDPDVVKEYYRYATEERPQSGLPPILLLKKGEKL